MVSFVIIWFCKIIKKKKLEKGLNVKWIQKINYMAYYNLIDIIYFEFMKSFQQGSFTVIGVWKRSKGSTSFFSFCISRYD